jgi:acetoin utilization deacetylase AcuC-like enzyme
VLLPAVAGFAPDLVLVSAGFDAYEDDPLAGMRVTRAGFAAMAARLRRLADTACGGRIVFTLEGGYDLSGLAGGMTEVLEAIVAPTAAAIVPADGAVAGAAEDAIAATLAAHRGVAGSPLGGATP